MAAAIGTWWSSSSKTPHIVSLVCSPQYREFASEIVAVTQINAQHVYETYASMSSQMTSSVQLAGDLMNWPQVLFPDFGAMMGNQIIDQTGTSAVTLIPFIQESPDDQHVLLKTNRHLYEEYVTDHHESWISNSLNYYSFAENSADSPAVPPRTPPPWKRQSKSSTSKPTPSKQPQTKPTKTPNPKPQTPNPKPLFINLI